MELDISFNDSMENETVNKSSKMTPEKETAKIPKRISVESTLIKTKNDKLMRIGTHVPNVSNKDGETAKKKELNVLLNPSFNNKDNGEGQSSDNDLFSKVDTRNSMNMKLNNNNTSQVDNLLNNSFLNNSQLNNVQTNNDNISSQSTPTKDIILTGRHFSENEINSAPVLLLEVIKY
jgi:hypothetical protein